MRSGLASQLATALAVSLAAGSGDAAASLASRERRVFAPEPPRRLAGAPRRAATWAAALEPVVVRSRNTGARASIKLYADDGGIDRGALDRFMQVAGPKDGALEPLDPRLVQLAIRAAYHFDGKPIVIVSATRKGAHGKHGTGDALDFQVEGVRAAVLASFLRATPRAGVGIYTHPKTQYVHLDVRDYGYHWIDGSPPGVTWRERLLPDPKRAARDAGYVKASDLPEAALR